jgi:hypothetical protein
MKNLSFSFSEVKRRIIQIYRVTQKTPAFLLRESPSTSLNNEKQPPLQPESYQAFMDIARLQPQHPFRQLEAIYKTDRQKLTGDA